MTQHKQPLFQRIWKTKNKSSRNRYFIFKCKKDLNAYFKTIYYFKGGEKLMIIGNWNDYEKSNDINSNQDTYHITINDKKISLQQLNKHVLQCVLPQFDSICTDTNKNEIRSYLNTFIYLYKSGSLLYPPIPFEIKVPSTIHTPDQKINIPAPIISNFNLKENANYKIKLFLLERTLILFKFYEINEIEFDYYASESLDSTQKICLFETRICKLISSLIKYVLSIKANNNNRQLSKNLNEIENAKLVLKNEHEGKTLLHLCSEAGLNTLFERLGQMRSHILNLDLSAEFDLIRNEVKLYTLDNLGNTPMVFINLIFFLNNNS